MSQHMRKNSSAVAAPKKTGEVTNPDFNAGKVYTPKFLAHWVASQLHECLTKNSSVTVLDPACGDGELLLAVKEKFLGKVSIVGTDIDGAAITNAFKKLPKGNFSKVDALLPQASKSIESAWQGISGGKDIDVLIANPPWGADLLTPKGDLLNAGYSLACGQFDSWELFIELSLKIVKQGGLIGLIIPDSIFLPEHEPLRRILNSKTTILSIARLGEGFFENVFRGTTVLVLKNQPPNKKHTVEVFRLNKEWRDSIFSSALGGEKILAKAQQALSHKIPQERFINDSFARWDIDSPEQEKLIVSGISAYCGEWTKWLETGRGVELSKTGRVIQCSRCRWALPNPTTPRQVICVNCGHSTHSAEATIQKIVELGGEAKEGWAPLIVGEDVDRYRAIPGRTIKTSVAGINYKNSEIYNRRRILVRKTGVGINASIVGAGPLINQVVFHYYEKDKYTPPFYLSYVLGVLCSRVMFAYHLRQNGENEWRSHPYLTQKVIARLPIPVPEQGNNSWKQAKAIAHAVDSLLDSPDGNKKMDFKIECLVAGLFGLKKDGVSWMRGVIDSAQQLEPMRVLKKIELASIEPIYA